MKSRHQIPPPAPPDGRLRRRARHARPADTTWPRACRTAADRRCAPTGFGRAARRAARSARVLAHHKGRRDRHHRHQRLRHRRHRRAGPRRAAAVLRPRPDAAARQHARRRGRPGRRIAVVPVVGRQHSARPQRAHGARGAEGRRRGHLGGAGHARGAAHRGRRRPVVAADRRGASAVAHRNRLALRRTRRAHPGAVAAQRPDRPPRRARPQDAAAAACATSNCSTRWPSPNWPTSIRAGRLASPTETLGEAHLALLNVRTELHRVSGRGRELLLAQHADEIGAALRIGDRFDLARMLSDAARTISYYVDAGLRTAANALPRRGLGRVAPAGAPSARRGRHRVRRRGDPGPRRPPRARSRPDPAGGGRVGHHRPADGGVDAGPARRDRAGAAHAVAAPGAQGSAGDAGRGPGGGGHDRGAGPNRPVGQAVPGMGRGARPAAARRRAHLDRRPPSRRNRLAGKRIHHPGVAARPAGAGRAVPRHRQGPRRRPQRHRRRTGHPDRHPARPVAVGRRDAVEGGAPPPAAAAHRDPPRSAGPRRPSRRCVDALDGDPVAAGAAARAGRGGLAGHRSRGVGRLEGLADRRPGAPLPVGDGR